MRLTRAPANRVVTLTCGFMVVRYKPRIAVGVTRMGMAKLSLSCGAVKPMSFIPSLYFFP